MLRVIFDTNIYGLIIQEDDSEELEQKIISEKEFIVYSYGPVREELRAIPKISKLSKKTRIVLLNLYDRVTESHFLENSIRITSLAKRYYDHYRHVGGIYGWDTNIRVDLMIVACASFHRLDVIYSEDSKTMVGKHAMKAYKHINLKENLRTPYFLKYGDLLNKFRD